MLEDPIEFESMHIRTLSFIEEDEEEKPLIGSSPASKRSGKENTLIDSVGEALEAETGAETAGVDVGVSQKASVNVGGDKEGEMEVGKIEKVLASDPEEEVNALNSKDAEPAPRESSKGSKGKSPSIPNYSRQTPNQGKPPENRPKNREMPASSSKGRGGSQTAFRGKGRGQGRNGSSNQPRRATLNEWFDHLGSDGVFQFGRSQPSTSGQERGNGTFAGSAQPLRNRS
nr:LINE-type retrotransposon LIb DNA [Ipomoea batatas]